MGKEEVGALFPYRARVQVCEVSLPVSRIGLGRYVSHPNLPGLAMGLGQCSKFLRSVVPSTMSA